MIEFSRRLGHKIRQPRRIGLNEGNFSLYLLCKFPPYHAGTTPAVCNCVALVSAPALNLPIIKYDYFHTGRTPGRPPRVCEDCGPPDGEASGPPANAETCFYPYDFNIAILQNRRLSRCLRALRPGVCSDKVGAMPKERQFNYTVKWQGLILRPLGRAGRSPPQQRPATPIAGAIGASPAGCDPLQRIVPLFVRGTGSPRPVIPFPPERAAAGRSASAFPWSFRPSPRRPRSPTAGIRPPASRT